MKTLKKIPVTVEYVYYMPDYETFKDNVLYVSNEFGCCIHKCLCGCGGKTVLSLKPHWSRGWTLTDDDGKITITPSIANYQTCGAHYIITNGVANIV